MKNIKYSHNGYNPKDVEIIKEKSRLNSLLERRIINLKQHSKAITELKSGWKRKTLLDVPVDELNNTEIVGTSFAQEEPNTKVFPDGMTGVVFVKCNLDNCIIPLGNTVLGGTHKQHAKQNDGEHWVLDKALQPVEPLVPSRYDRLGLSKEPKDIPATPMKRSIILEAETLKVQTERKEKLLALAQNPTALDEWSKEGGEI